MSRFGKRWIGTLAVALFGLGLGAEAMAREAYQPGNRPGGYGYRAPGLDRVPADRSAQYGRPVSEAKHGWGSGHDGWRDDRHDRRDRRHDRRDWRHDRRDWRHDDRKHWNAWHDHRPRYRAPSHYVRPYGWVERRWVSGHYLPTTYYARPYIVTHYDRYGLRHPPHGHRWVRVDGDVLLVALATGLVVDALYDWFYW